MTEQRQPIASDASPEQPERPEQPDHARTRRHRSRHRTVPWWRRRRTFVLLGTLAALGLVLVVGAIRYSGLVHDGLALRDSMDRLAGDIKTIGTGFDRTALNRLQTDLDDVESRLGPVRDTVGSDPLVALLRAAPPTGDQVRGADRLLACAADLTQAGDHGLIVARRYVQIREAGGQGNGSQMADMVSLMASSRADVTALADAIQAARGELNAMPQGLVSQLADARNRVLGELQRVQPELDGYLRVQDQLPDMLGMSGPRRYLVLAEDPAELRPSGGFIGTYGLVTFDRGRITKSEFQNTLLLDFKPGLPYVEPPTGLKNHLLGTQYSWQLADAGWSPDFPTAAQKALELYTLESGDSQVDGVIAVDTYGIDLVLGVTGPISVPGYGVTFTAGQTTMTALANTRQPTDPSTDRKAILAAFGGELLNAMLTTPTARWPDLMNALSNAASQRQLMVWTKDEGAEALIGWAGWDGAVRQDQGDYVEAVDANVAPTSKYNLVTHRTQDLAVQIDDVGNANDTLTLNWDNRADQPEASALRKLPYTGTSTVGMLGDYLRVLTPDRSRLQSVSGGRLVQLTGVEEISSEAGRTAYGLFLLEPPGLTSATISWISPYPVETDDTTGLYRLTVQKEAGRPAEPLSVRVTVPEGATILEMSAGMAVNGRTATLQTTPATDVQLWVRYSLPKAAISASAGAAGRASSGVCAGGVSRPSLAPIMATRLHEDKLFTWISDAS
jgi:hypothetical protein